MFKSRHILANQVVDFERFTYSKQQCDALYDMICVDDEIHPNITLPDHIHFDYTQEQLIAGFMISRQLWVEGVDNPDFPLILSGLCHSINISAEDKVIYKMMRAKFKHLCYGYRAFDDRHQRPFLLGHITGLLGVVQDGFKNRKNTIVKPNAILLKLLWNDSGLSWLNNEVNRFFPCDVEGFITELGKRARFIKTHVKTHPTISAHEFHTVRKHISMFSALYGTLDVLFPSSYHHQMFHYMATINGLMGDYHDILVEKKLANTQNYFFDRFVMPQEILSKLQDFTEAFAS